ncbi:hypothetical protein NFI96_004478, partial [Prochilodus magdalenae]
VKLKTWLEKVQTSDPQPTFTADDFHVVQYAPLGKPDSVKVILLYKGLPNMDTEKFWDEVLKYLKDKKLISASEKTITYVDLTEGKTPIIICLLLSAERHVTERLLNQGFFILDQKIFKAENLKHLGSEEWEVILKAWFNNPQNKTGSQYPAQNAADFKVVTYPLLEQPDFINVMLFYKGIPKEKTEKFWDKQLKSEPPSTGRGKTAVLDSSIPPQPEEAAPGGILSYESFQKAISALGQEIGGKIDSLAAELRSSIDSLTKRIDDHNEVLTELSQTASSHSDAIAKMESSLLTLRAEVKTLTTKCEDLEGRQRRNNIRLFCVPEGIEGPRPTEFVSGLMQELLRLEPKPILDRAHRSLWAKPKSGEPQQPFIIRVHLYQTRELILRRAREVSTLQYQGKRLSVFPDFTSAVAKKRAEFVKVKCQLRDYSGIKFGLYFPAELRISLPDGRVRKFDDPSAAQEFIHQELKSLAAVTIADGKD